MNFTAFVNVFCDILCNLSDKNRGLFYGKSTNSRFYSRAAFQAYAEICRTFYGFKCVAGPLQYGRYAYCRQIYRQCGDFGCYVRRFSGYVSGHDRYGNVYRRTGDDLAAYRQGRKTPAQYCHRIAADYEYGDGRNNVGAFGDIIADTAEDHANTAGGFFGRSQLSGDLRRRDNLSLHLQHCQCGAARRWRFGTAVQVHRYIGCTQCAA